MNEILTSVENGSQQVNEMVQSIIGESTQQIDEFIDKVKYLFLSADNLSDTEIDKIMLEIPVYIYYLSSVLQTIEVKKGVAAENAKFYENEHLITATGTVAEKQARANNSTIKNRVVALAFKSATSLIQNKINGAMEVLSSAKRVQQRRLEEMKLAKMAGSAVGGAF